MLRLPLMCGLCGLCLSLAFAGCSGNDLPKPVSVTPGASPALKQMLDGVAESGELGSGAEAIQTELDNLAKTDAAKAKALKADLEKMQKLSEPDEVKGLAKQMAGKLSS